MSLAYNSFSRSQEAARNRSATPYLLIRTAQTAQAKFKSCIESVCDIKPENKEQDHVDPVDIVTHYVPGKLADLENVIVDVGTGYFVEKSTADATKMYQEKVESSQRT